MSTGGNDGVKVPYWVIALIVGVIIGAAIMVSKPTAAPTKPPTTVEDGPNL